MYMPKYGSINPMKIQKNNGMKTHKIKKVSHNNNKKRLLSFIMLFIIIGIMIGNSLYVSNEKSVNEIYNIDFEVNLIDQKSINVNYNVQYKEGANYIYEGNIFINNYSTNVNFENNSGFFIINNIPNINYYLAHNNFNIQFNGTLIISKGFAKNTIKLINNIKISIMPKISCNYHPYGDYVETYFTTEFKSPFTNIQSDKNITISYNTWINVSQEEIDHYNLNFGDINETGWYYVGNVNITHLFDNSFVYLNNTMIYNFYYNIYNSPDALWTSIIDLRLSNYQKGYPTIDPKVKITNISIYYDEYMYNYLSDMYIDVNVS